MTETLVAERKPPLKTPPSATNLNVTKPVFDFETVKVQTKIDNQEDLAELISRLEKIKTMLPMKSEENTRLRDLAEELHGDCTAHGILTKEEDQRVQAVLKGEK